MTAENRHMLGRPQVCPKCHRSNPSGLLLPDQCIYCGGHKMEAGNRELDKWLAENVMGWRYEGLCYPMKGPYYLDKDINIVMLVADWTPTANHEQAYECEGKIPIFKRTSYIECLMTVTKTEYLKKEGYEICQAFSLIHATAEQRCKAIKAMEGRRYENFIFS